jgi:hypothetical protein
MISYVKQVMGTNSSLQDSAMLKASKTGYIFFNGTALYEAIIDSAA